MALVPALVAVAQSALDAQQHVLGPPPEHRPDGAKYRVAQYMWNPCDGLGVVGDVCPSTLECATLDMHGEIVRGHTAARSCSNRPLPGLGFNPSVVPLPAWLAVLPGSRGAGWPAHGPSSDAIRPVCFSYRLEHITLANGPRKDLEGSERYYGGGIGRATKKEPSIHV